MTYIKLQMPDKIFFRNILLCLAAAIPFIRICLTESGFSLAAFTMVSVSFAVFCLVKLREQTLSRSFTGFLILSSCFLFMIGDKEGGLIGFFYSIAFYTSFFHTSNDTIAASAVICLLYGLLPIVSSDSAYLYLLDKNVILSSILHPLSLIAALLSIRLINDESYSLKNRYVLPSTYLSPLINDNRSTDDAWLMMFLNSLDEGIFIANREGTIINASHQFASFFEARPDDLAGFSIFDQFALPQTHQNKAFNLIKKNMDGLPSGPDEFVFELKSGKKIRLLVMTMPIIIEGTPSVMGIAKPLHRNLKSNLPKKFISKDKFQTLSENSTDIIIRFDRNLRHVYANYAITGLTGMAVENFLGKTCHETKYPKPILEMLNEKVQRVFETGEPIETEFYHDWGTGEVYFDLRLIPEKNKHGEVETVLSTARDITQLKKAHMTIQTLNQELIRAQELERNRIALDLHDNVAQDLASLKIACDTIFDQEPLISDETEQRFRHFSGLLKNAIDSVRELAYNLRPPGIDQLGVVKTLSQLCAEFTSSSGIKADFQSWGVDSLSISPDTQINLYRMMQESLNNVKKHSRANNVNIKLVSSHPNIILRVEDDGKGFDVEKRSEEAVCEKRMGLQGMRERVRMIGGRMKILSRIGEGTKVIIEVPVVKKSDMPEDERIAIHAGISL